VNRRIFTFILSLGIAALFAPGLALADVPRPGFETTGWACSGYQG
jgi:hypothetical protein